MASYKLETKRSVEKDLARLPKEAAHRVSKRIPDLAADPRPPQAIRLTGTEASFRLRVGDYRVIYTIDDAARLVTIFKVRHRKEAYR